MKKPNSIKKYQSLYEESAVNRIFSVLFRFPDKEFSLTDLAKEAGVAKANIGKILDNLHSAEIIEITKLNVTWRIRANQRNRDFIKSKIIYNLNAVFQSGLVELLDEIYNHPKAIVLFGSFRKGEDISNSDIDIAVETDQDVANGYIALSLQQLPELTSNMSKGIMEFEKNINRHIQIHVFNREGIDAGVFNNIANGIVLLGFLEVKL